MKEGKNRIDLSFYLDKEVALFVQDRNNVQRKDGVLRGYDDVNYYLEMTHGPRKGNVIGFLRTIVIRIEPVDSERGGDHHRWQNV